MDCQSSQSIGIPVNYIVNRTVYKWMRSSVGRTVGGKAGGYVDMCGLVREAELLNNPSNDLRLYGALIVSLFGCAHHRQQQRSTQLQIVTLV